MNQQTSSEPIVRDIQIPRLIANRVYTFALQTNASPGVVSSTTIEVYASFSFSLNNILNASAFTTIFDAYRIEYVNMKFYPTSSQVGVPVYTVIDYDDTTTTTIASMQNYDTLKVAPPGAYFERSFTPRVALAAYSGTFTSYAQKSHQWLDCASPAVAHYGLKYGTPVSATPTTWSIAYVLYIQFRNIR